MPQLRFSIKVYLCFTWTSRKQIFIYKMVSCVKYKYIAEIISLCNIEQLLLNVMLFKKNCRINIEDKCIGDCVSFHGWLLCPLFGQYQLKLRGIKFLHCYCNLQTILFDNV